MEEPPPKDTKIFYLWIQWRFVRTVAMKNNDTDYHYMIMKGGIHCGADCEILWDSLFAKSNLSWLPPMI